MLRALKRLLAAVFLSIACLVIVSPGVMAESRTLSRDTKLHPQGWSVGEGVEFRKNTEVMLNTAGEVISGTLDNDTFLQPRGWRRVINDYYYTTMQTDVGPFLYRHYYPLASREYEVAIPGYGHLLYKGGTIVAFSEQGDVISGTLADKATVRLVEEQYGFVTFKGNSVLTFYSSGAVQAGVLEEDTFLRPFGWQHLQTGDAAGFVKFSKGKAVTFTENGELISGTVKDAVTLQDKDGSSRKVAAGSTVDFVDINILPQK